MRSLIATLSLILIATIGSAISSADDYLEFGFTLPSDAACASGEVSLHNCELLSIKENYRNKDVYTNGQKFALYSLNNYRIGTGNLMVRVRETGTGVVTVGLANLSFATQGAQAYDETVMHAERVSL